MKHSLPVACVDLFCGAGGLTHGLLRKGVEVRAGVDMDPACRYAYEANNKGAKFLERDVESLTMNEISDLFPEEKYSLLAGCAPCQPFSTYAKGKDTSGDAKWRLLRSFAAMVRKVQPDLVTMENVPQLPKHAIFDEFLEAFDGYHIWKGIVECEAYGIPQRRRRLVFLASRLGPISLIPPTHSKRHPTVADTIGYLPSIKAGSAHWNDPLHAAAGMTELNLKRIRQSRPGGSWHDWDEELVAECHRRDSGKTFPSVYGRMRWDKPAPTMTTLCYGFGNGRFGHPAQDRAISLREAALFQTFPKTYKFAPKDEQVNFRVIGRLIGNAVPVRLGEVVAMSIKKHLKQLEASLN
ncbi:DNA cytosine methyltransferase [Xanthomonas arboricola]|uniref:DNA cytosine methyltransferase n=1 Tax=Xanthomonas arboricola TaxID=56448 RepID=UPI000CEF20E9|nr:DNA cytosine methyltransferase [Xanthomonas arboricola]PPT64311.1 DNA (cytosine-5-)-methyltransferase [Xanthomonas arboricola]